MTDNNNNKIKFSTESAEEGFRRQLLKQLNLRKEEEVHVVTSCRLEERDYAEHVGYIRALKDIEQDVTQLLKAYFPTT